MSYLRARGQAWLRCIWSHSFSVGIDLNACQRNGLWENKTISVNQLHNSCMIVVIDWLVVNQLHPTNGQKHWKWHLTNMMIMQIYTQPIRYPYFHTNQSKCTIISHSPIRSDHNLTLTTQVVPVLGSTYLWGYGGQRVPGRGWSTCTASHNTHRCSSLSLQERGTKKMEWVNTFLQSSSYNVLELVKRFSIKSFF